MKRLAPFNTSIKQMCTMLDKGTIALDNPYQRPSGQWNKERESLAIHSVFTFFIPELTAIKEKRVYDNKEVNVYDTVDGRQRATTFNRFRKDEIVLDKLEPFVSEIDGEEYDISGMKYSDLPDLLREQFDSYVISIRPVELDEGEDKATASRELVYRLNNGVKMSNAHLAVVRSQPETSEYVQGVIESHPLFKKTAHFAVGSVIKSEPQMSAFQSIALIGKYDVATYGTSDITKLFETINVPQDVFETTTKAFDFIYEALPEYTKFVSKVFVPVCAAFVVENDFNEDIKSFLKHYVANNKKDDSYRKWSRGGTTKKDSIQGRINGLQNLYEQYKQGYTEPEEGQAEILG